jgi:hypothetical protein
VEKIPPAAAPGTAKRIPDIHELQLENEIVELRRWLGERYGERR